MYTLVFQLLPCHVSMEFEINYLNKPRCDPNMFVVLNVVMAMLFNLFF